MTGEKANEILVKLYEVAIPRYLDKSNWDYTEWLTDNELKQYNKAQGAIDNELV